MEINKEFLDKLLEQAKANPRLRQNYDLRTSPTDNSQRMLNALMPGTQVPIHRHPDSTENVLLLCGKIVEKSLTPSHSPKGEGSGMPCCGAVHDIEEARMELVETERVLLCPAEGKFGCVVPQGAWHTVEVLEPSVIYEAKDGKYGEDGSETFDDYIAKKAQQQSRSSSKDASAFSNCLGDLKKNIEYLIGMERQSGSMDVITPLYVSRMLNVPLEDVERVMQEMVL